MIAAYLFIQPMVKPMPIYEWKCPRCKGERETLQAYEAEAPMCQSCKLDAGGPVRMVRRISLTSFSLKGKGWASDGYEG